MLEQLVAVVVAPWLVRMRWVRMRWESMLMMTTTTLVLSEQSWKKKKKKMAGHIASQNTTKPNREQIADLANIESNKPNVAWEGWNRRIGIGIE